MDSLSPGNREIGYLIMTVACGGEPFAQQGILPGTLILRSFLEPAGSDHTLQGTVFLHRKLVGGNMLWRQGQSPVNRVRPDLVGQLRQTEYEIKAYIADTAASQDAERLNGGS